MGKGSDFLRVFFFFSKGIHRLVVFSSLTYFELDKNSLQKHSMFINYKYLTHRKQPSYSHFSGWAQPCEQECLFFCDTARGEHRKGRPVLAQIFPHLSEISQQACGSLRLSSVLVFLPSPHIKASEEIVHPFALSMWSPWLNGSPVGAESCGVDHFGVIIIRMRENNTRRERQKPLPPVLWVEEGGTSSDWASLYHPDFVAHWFSSQSQLRYFHACRSQWSSG